MRALIIVFVLCLSTSFSQSGWTNNPDVNTPLAAWSLDQFRPALAPARDSAGGWFVAWYDNGPDSPYPTPTVIRMLRFDRDGNRVWDGMGPALYDFDDILSGGVKALDLDADPKGNAFLTFCDPDYLSPGTFVTRVGPNGPSWPSGTVAVSDQASFPPQVAATGDGGAVVAFQSNSGLELKGLSKAGAIIWERTIPAGTGREGQLADLEASTDGSVIVAYIRNRSGLDDWVLKIAKISVDGLPLWEPLGVIVSESGYVSPNSYPHLNDDGSGGTAVAWCDDAGRCYVQHLRADGVKAFAGNGIPVTGTTSRTQDLAAAAYLPVEDSIVVFWRDQSGADEGISAQKVTREGVRAWGEEGVEVLPLGPDHLDDLSSFPASSGGLGLWRSMNLDHGLKGWYSRANGEGTLVCPPALFTSSYPEYPLAAQDGKERVLVIWQRSGTSSTDIFGQDVNSDCLLGLPSLPHEVGNTLRFAGQTTLAWDPVNDPVAAWFNVYRGDLPFQPGAGAGDCFASEIWFEQTAAEEEPPTSSIWFFLVSAENTTGEGSLGYNSSGQERVASSSCP